MASSNDAPAVSTRVAGVVTVACAAAFLAMYVVVALVRMRYPFELEWLEGGTLDHVERIVAGRPLYAAPSLDFAPFVYPPLYYAVCAVAVRLVGEGFVVLRLVSFLSSLGCFAVLFAWTRRETGSTAAGVTAAGFLAATYRLGGAWLDVGRVDTLFLFLVLAGACVLRVGRGAGAHIAAGVLVSLSILTKQTALVVGPGLAVYCALFERGARRFAFAATVAAITAAATIALDAASGGWYRYYVFDLPLHQAPGAGMIHRFWIHDVAVPLAGAFAVTVTWLSSIRRGDDRRTAAFFLLFIAGMMCASWFTRMRVGGYNNALLPANAALALGFGVGAARLAPGLFGRSGAGGHRPLAAIVALLCVIQFAGLVYDPRAQIPSAADRRAGDEVVRLLQSIDGDVLVPYHGHLAAMAGKRTLVQAAPLEGMLGEGDPGVYRAFEDSLAAAIDGGRFGAIVLDAPWHLDAIERRYSLRGQVFPDGDTAFWPVTGMQTRPAYLYIRDTDG